MLKPSPIFPRAPLLRNVHKPHARDAHRYRLIDDLKQSPTTMSTLDVLHTFPFQTKAFISQLGEVYRVDTHLIIFDLEKKDPRLPSLVAFQIPIEIMNITIHHCIIFEGESTCIMSKIVWKKLGSPELFLSSITLRAYDDRPSQPEGLYQNVPIELGGKTILIDIEVIDSQLYYNILFGHSYIYTIQEVSPSIFCTMLFAHNGKIVTIVQLDHYEPNQSGHIDNILPLIFSKVDLLPMIDARTRFFHDPSLIVPYQEYSLPPQV
jgi:hypothetical protein